jgi:undecaprenyl-diphosphatase
MSFPAAFLSAVRVLWPAGLNAGYFLDVNHFARRSAWAHGFMHDYALWLGLVLMTATFLVAYALAWWRRNVDAAALLALGGVGTVVALGLNQLVGHAARELRPYDTYRHALVLVSKANDYSFPSEHAVVAGALLTSVALVLRRAVQPETVGRARSRLGRSRTAAGGTTSAMVVLVALGTMFCLLLCFARVYVGAHYPGDVVAGLLLGAVVVLAVSVARPVAYRTADLLAGSALSGLVRRPAEEQAPVDTPGAVPREDRAAPGSGAAGSGRG